MTTATPLRTVELSARRANCTSLERSSDSWETQSVARSLTNQNSPRYLHTTVTFEWDNDKAQRNVRKHGVTFDEAATAFGDPLSVTIDDPDHSLDQQRLLLLGQTLNGKLLVIAHLDDGETIRIISARMANRHERRQYEEG